MASAPDAAPTGYRTSQIALHWLVVVLVAFLFFTGDNRTDAFEALRKSGGSARNYAWIPIHMTCGLLVLGAMIWRLVLRRLYGVPRPPVGESAPPRILAVGDHHLLYLLLMSASIVVVVGFFLAPQAAALHHFMVRLPLMVLVGLHVIGSLWHLDVLRDNVFQCMLYPI
jgi:cytochrome b561